MWFKNLQLFRFTEDFTLDIESMEAALSAQRFVPCRSSDPTSQGFVPPNGDKDGALVYAGGGFFLFCLKTEQKIVPGPVIKEMLDEKIAEIELAQGRKVRQREKESLKEDIVHQLVLRAFSKSRNMMGYIDTIDSLLVVNASSHAQAEEFTVALRNAFGSLKIELPKVQNISTLLTHWLKDNEYPAEFTINDQCILSDPKEQGSIRCQRQNLFAEDIQTLIHEGRFVSDLSLSWSEQLSFRLKDDFSIKSIKFLDLIQDEAKDVVAETSAARFDADFTIMTTSLRHFIRALFQAFGAQT
jgi:recombination associated protein RdgC